MNKIIANAVKSLSLVNKSMALEAGEDTSGTSAMEIEHVLYGRITDFKVLEQAAAKIEQEQWGIYVPHSERNAAEGSVRVRKTVEDGKTTYIQTTKIRKVDGKLETSIEVTEDMFKSFQVLAHDGLIKDRFNFPVPNSDLVWEVDVFKLPDGAYCEWCKLDLEVSSKDTPIPALPFALEDVILPDGYGRQDPVAAGKFVEELYSKYFKSTNPGAVPATDA